MDDHEERCMNLSLRSPVLTLANAFCACIEADEEEAAQVHSLLLCAGEDLAQTVGCGAWAELDVRDFLSRFPSRSEDERGANAVQLMGFYGWLGMVGLLEPASVKQQVRAIARAAPADPAILDYGAQLESAADAAATADDGHRQRC